MPELPEVETIKNQLKRKLIGKTIKKVDIYYNKIIENIDSNDFKLKLENQKILNIDRRGKWLIFELDNYYLLSHLRMEGKYFIKEGNMPINKHEHVVFIFDDFELRYQDTRKFGRMHLINKNEEGPLSKLGLEPFDEKLNVEYLKDKYKKKNIAIKTCLLDQEIIAGIGNIYADEILFLSKINPLKKASSLDENELNEIIINTKKILNRAISLGGTTIHTYASLNGISGGFQKELFVHLQDVCRVCNTKIEKIVVAQRGTYYCPKCQDKK